MGHVMKDCLSHRANIATNDGGYISASDVEDDLALATNLVANSKEDEGEALDCHGRSQEYCCATCVEYIDGT
jgi:hypothetical protein